MLCQHSCDRVVLPTSEQLCGVSKLYERLEAGKMDEQILIHNSISSLIHSRKKKLDSECY